ncbi:MAG: VTT domain-containing protein [Archangium sp.]
MAQRTKLIVALLALVTAAVAGRLLLGDRFNAQAVIAWLREAGTSGAAIPLFLLLFGVITTLFGPALAMMVAAGVTWGFWPGWLLVWIGANLWANVHFAIGRWMAGDTLRRWLDARGAKWLTTELNQGGTLTTIMIRQLPLPFVLVNLAGGASPMPWWRWAVGNAVGLVPNCIIYTSLAAALADGAEDAKRDGVIRVLVSGALIIGMSLLTRFVQRRLAAKRAP